MSKTVKDLITLSFIVGFGLAILANPKGTTTIIGTIANDWFNLIKAAAGNKTR